jgi:DNA-binding MarR family transcriptional regulator
VKLNDGAGGTVDSIGESFDAAADLTVRHLTDRSGLSVSASLVLNRLDRQGPMKLTVLAAAEGISQPAMSQLVRRLELQGLLERLCDRQDGRVAWVAIASSGRAMLADRTEGRRNRLADLLTALSPEDEMTLELALKVALPIVRRLLESAASASTLAADLERASVLAVPSTATGGQR